MTDAVSSDQQAAPPAAQRLFQRDVGGFGLAMTMGLFRRRHGAAVVARIMDRIPHLREVIERPPTWVTWQECGDMMAAIEAEIPDVDPALYHQDWLSHRPWALPLFGLLRAGVSPETIFANAGRIIRMVAPSLEVTTEFHSRGSVVDLTYTLRFPSHCPPIGRRWVTASFAHSHQFLLRHSPRVRSLRVEPTRVVDSHAVSWRIRWLTAPLWWPMAVVVMSTAVGGWYFLGWPGAGVAGIPLVAWWLGRRESRADAQTLAGFLHLSDKSEDEHRELAMRRRHMASLERRHQAGIVAARMIHEFTGPLATLRMACDQRRREGQESQLGLIPQAVERLENIVQTVRNAHQSAPPTRTRCSVVDLVGLIGSIGKDLVGGSVMELTVTPLDPVLSDRCVTVVDGAVEMITDNVLRNARDAALPGQPAKVTIAALIDGEGRVAVRFSDQGVGMTPHVASMAIAGLSSKTAGLGIGLSLCCELSMQMGADLRIVRTAPGQGTEIELRWMD